MTRHSGTGTVLSASRRFVEVLTSEHRVISAKTLSKTLSVTVGDLVDYEQKQNDFVVTAQQQPRNSLERSYQGTTRRIAANLDRLFLVAAADPLFNVAFIDRVLAVAHQQSIPVTLVVNKSDLDQAATEPLIAIYEKIGVTILRTTTREKNGIAPLVQTLTDTALKIAAFVGISGVGKSSILSVLLPEIPMTVQEVSKRTGQGRQTTTQATAHIYREARSVPLLLIDLPGIQQFGASHLSPFEVSQAFPEFLARAAKCEFSNCSHIGESKCAVKDAVEKGEIAQSRYRSYCGIIEEIREAQPF